MLWIKTLHIISFVAWFSGLFYLPRLFVYHSMSYDEISCNRFKVMEARLYKIIMWPAGLATVAFGTILITYNTQYYLSAGWMHAKLLLVFILVIYHIYCGKLINDLNKASKIKSTRFYRIFNEVPTILLFLIVIMVIVKPF